MKHVSFKGLDLSRASKRDEKCRFQGLREYFIKGATNADFTGLGLGRISKSCENCRFLGLVLRVALPKWPNMHSFFGLCLGCASEEKCVESKDCKLQKQVVGHNNRV